MIGISRTIGSRSGRLGDIGSNSGKERYSGSGSVSGIGSTPSTSLYSNEARGGYRNSRRSIGVGVGETSATFSR